MNSSDVVNTSPLAEILLQFACGRFNGLAAFSNKQQQNTEEIAALEALRSRLQNSLADLQALARGDTRTMVRTIDGADDWGAGLEILLQRELKLLQLLRRAARGEIKIEVTARNADPIFDVLAGWCRDQDALVASLEALAAGQSIEPLSRGPGDALFSALAKLAKTYRRRTRQLEHLVLGGTSDPIRVCNENDELGLAMQRQAERQIEIKATAAAVVQGNYNVRITRLAEEDAIAEALNAMLDTLTELARDNQRRLWLEEGLARLSETLRGDWSQTELAERALAALTEVLAAPIGAFYLANDDSELMLTASRGFSHRLPLSDRITAGRGLLGIAVAQTDIMTLRDVPADYLPIGSGLGETGARGLLLMPICYLGTCYGAVELAKLGAFSANEVDLARRAVESIAVTMGMAKARHVNAELLTKSQTLNDELQTQQEELRVMNEELEERNKRLQTTEEELRQQSEELQALNEELEEKSLLLEQQKAEVDQKNRVLELTGQELEDKAAELEISSRYKSEFLANMSHELRTPLNSLLLLSRMLLDNEDNNLTEDQLESMRIIHKGGQDLLALINDILDLSKIEAGKLVFHQESVVLSELLNGISDQLKPMATKKGLNFEVTFANEAPEAIESDGQRIEQVLKNLLSNALKFTHTGGISLHVAPIVQSVRLPHGKLDQGVMISVCDTGIGIPLDRQRDIWEAFQQADGSTSRKFGGTGLGLTISRQLAWHLGGEILLNSTPEQGATFTLALPLALSENLLTTSSSDEPRIPVIQQAVDTVTATTNESVTGVIEAGNALNDDRDVLTSTDRIMLIIEDDLDFARIVMRQVHKKHLKALVAVTGGEGLALAQRFKPEGIMLDLGLPDMDGREVLRKLKNDQRTRVIPVHIVSASDRDPVLLQMGAAAYLKKPVQAEDLAQVFETLARFDPNRARQVLIVEDDPGTQAALSRLLSRDGTVVRCLSTGREALTLLTHETVDCLILDLRLPDMDGLEFLKALQLLDGPLPPVVVHTGKDLSEQEYKALREYSERIVVKGAQSPERLLEEVSLFLHTVGTHLPTAQQTVVMAKDALLGRKVLIVDDDVRNTFALAKALRPYGLDVVLADDGQLALEKLEQDHGIELVLMDIMMPVLDGYETMRLIRAQPRWQDLPIIALTAKAMTEDKQKCLQAGANDYLSKPIDIERLLSMIQIWLNHRME